MKKIVLRLIFAICFSLIVTTFAVVASAQESGECGEFAEWSLDDNGVLKISGTGQMEDYTSYRTIPWYFMTDQIKEVVIENGITNIADYAFYQCENLEQVTFGDTVETIGAKAFGYCSSLKAIPFPDSVKTIGDSCFIGCSGVTELTLNKGVTSVGPGAFSGMNSLEKIQWNAESIGDFSMYDQPFSRDMNASTKLTVTFGTGVTRIPAYIFSQYGSVYKIVMSDSVEVVGAAAFDSCISLEEIVFSQNLKEIENNVFSGCTALTGVILPDSVEKLGKSAFYGCKGITELSLGKNLKEIGEQAFYALEKITTISLPETLTMIGQYAFAYCQGLTEMDIPDTVISIDQYAFAYCRGLLKINLGESLETIGNYAFRETAISEITLPDSVKQLSIGVFTDCKSLKTVTIGRGVVGIRQNAFKNCVVLENVFWNAVSIPDYLSSFDIFNHAGVDGDGIKVVFGDSVENIPAYVFSPSSQNYRSKIKEITIGENVKTIGNYAFDDAVYLEKIYWNATNVNDLSSDAQYSAYTFSKAGTSTDGIELVFGNKVERIPAFAFCANNTSTFKSPKITKAVLSDSITEIGDYGFGNCDYLKEILWGDNVTSIGNYAFFNCTSLESLCLPEKIKTIGDWAFGSCNALTEIILPDSVSQIGEYSFRSCTGLTDLVLSENLSVVSANAFEMCSKMTTLTIQKGTTLIGDSAFYACDGLKTVNYCGDEAAWQMVIVKGYNNPLLNATFVFGYSVPTGGTISFDALSKTINIDSARSYNNVCMIVVMYKNDAVYNIAPCIVTIKKGENSFLCPFDSLAGADKISIMTWENFSKMKPLFLKCEEASV